MDKETPPADESPSIPELDLRGVRCPLNWARARVHLETLPRGALLRVRVDDPRAVRDLPRAAEACGYAMLEVSGADPEWQLLLQV